MAYSEKQVKELARKARQIRTTIVEIICSACSGHPGGSLSAADLITVLYLAVMRHDPKNPSWPERDRFHMSKGHCCPLWYTLLAECGYFPKEELKNLRKLGSRLQGHPDRRCPGVDVASGSLGQGLSVALGMSLAGRMDKKDYRVYCLMGDGEIQEGNIWEAAMAAAHYRCDNLCAILDYNGFQIDGKVSQVMGIEPVAQKWQAFGWHTIEIDGHDIRAILDAFEQARAVKGKPQIVIARTTKGKGVSFMENVCSFHGSAPTPAEAQKACTELTCALDDSKEI